MRHTKQQIMACDFFTVETLWLQTLYVLLYIEVGTRRVDLTGVTAHPDGYWVAQQARPYVWTLEACEDRPCILIRDNDKKFTGGHDWVFRSESVCIIRTPSQAPNANAYAERWFRTVREECLRHLLILNEKHLRRVLQAFIDYYNTARPHQGLEPLQGASKEMPIHREPDNTPGPVRLRDVLGFISDTYRGPDPTAICLA
jgi:putative transposase